MPKRLTKAEAEAFCDRWRIANEREIEEMRSASMEVKLQQIATLMEWAKHFKWPADREREVAKVRARWARLRKVLGG